MWEELSWCSLDSTMLVGGKTRETFRCFPWRLHRPSANNVAEGRGDDMSRSEDTKTLDEVYGGARHHKQASLRTQVHCEICPVHSAPAGSSVNEKFAD